MPPATTNGDADASEAWARARQVIARYPELELVSPVFDAASSSGGETTAALLEAYEGLLMQMKSLLNPTALPLHLGADRRVLTMEFDDVATFITDIRGFTELSRNVAERWGVKVFDLLSFSYFSQVTELLERWDCHYLNYTGDGLLVLTLGKKDDKGRTLLPSLDHAVLCALDLISLTNAIAEVWSRQGLVQSSGRWHETGIGLAAGDVQVGDPFVPDRDPTGRLAEFDRMLHAILAEKMPHFVPRRDFSGRVRAIHAMSPAINTASRLQDQDKSFPDHTIMMLDIDVEKLCPPLRTKFVRCGTVLLRGIGERAVFGVDRFARHDVPALMEECLGAFRGPTLELTFVEGPECP
ncbi:hypothetical protein DFJ74DRAFT_713562 [Hyaloraphidium curvatum]|nr:hypothetical protein DFJ74DRAFT_713562 [Hyaloraphidium curvatum]